MRALTTMPSAYFGYPWPFAAPASTECWNITPPLSTVAPERRSSGSAPKNHSCPNRIEQKKGGDVYVTTQNRY